MAVAMADPMDPGTCWTERIRTIVSTLRIRTRLRRKTPADRGACARRDLTERQTSDAEEADPTSNDHAGDVGRKVPSYEEAFGQEEAARRYLFVYPILDVL